MIVSLEECGPADPSPGPAAAPQAAVAFPSSLEADSTRYCPPSRMHEGQPWYLPGRHSQKEQLPYQLPLQQQQQPYAPREWQMVHPPDRQRQPQLAHAAGAERTQPHSQQPPHPEATGCPDESSDDHRPGAAQDSGKGRPSNLSQAEWAGRNAWQSNLQQGQVAPTAHEAPARVQMQPRSLQGHSDSIHSLPGNSDAYTGRYHPRSHLEAAIVEPQTSQEGTGFRSHDPGSELGSCQPAEQLPQGTGCSMAPSQSMTGRASGTRKPRAVLSILGSDGLVGRPHDAAHSNAGESGIFPQAGAHPPEQHCAPDAAPTGAVSHGAALQPPTACQPASGHQLSQPAAGLLLGDGQLYNNPTDPMLAPAGLGTDRPRIQDGSPSCEARSPEQQAALDALAANVSSLDAVQQPRRPRWVLALLCILHLGQAVLTLLCSLSLPMNEVC